MQRRQLFAQPDFIPPLERAEGFAGLRIGMTGARGVLGRLLRERLRVAGVAAECYPGDITDAAALDEWFAARPFDLFFHLAALVPVGPVARDPARAFRVNALGAFEVCIRAAAGNPKCWTFAASTSHVYEPTPAAAWRALAVGDRENPASIYGRTKLAGECLCRQALEALGTPYCIGRIFSFSHESQVEPFFVPTLVRRITDLRQGQPLTLENAASVRDIVDAETVIDCILYLARQRFLGTINVGSGAASSIAEIAARIGARLERTFDVVPESRGTPDALVAEVTPLRQVIREAAGR